jgi:hypothetical protein
MKTKSVSPDRGENLKALKAALRAGTVTDQGALGLTYATRYEPAAESIAALAKALGGKVLVRKTGTMKMSKGSASQPWKVDMDLGTKVETFLLSPTMTLNALTQWESA